MPSSAGEVLMAPSFRSWGSPSIAQPHCDCVRSSLEVEACREVWSAEEVTTVSARRQIASGLADSLCTDAALDPSFSMPLLICLPEFR
jgi:hypothetical protein